MKLLGLLAFIVLEFYLLIRVGAEAGALAVVIWCILTALLGAWVVRTHGLSVVNGMQADLVSGLRPRESLLSASLVFLSGLLLVIPGFITDALGFILLVPMVRKTAAAPIGSYFMSMAQKGGTGSSGSSVFFRGVGQGFDFGSRAGRGEEEDERTGQDSFGAESQVRGQRQAWKPAGTGNPRQVTIIDVTPGKIEKQVDDDAGNNDSSPDRP